MAMTDRTPAVPHLLLIEDDDGVRRGLQLLLTGQGYRVHAFSRPSLAITDPAAIAATHLVIDYALPQTDGVAALQFLKSQGWKGLAVLVTAYYSSQLRDIALAAGFAAVLAKPFRDANLLEALARA